MKAQDERMTVPLTVLQNGENGVIISVGTDLEDGRRGRGWGAARRLMDMGLTPGTHVIVVKAAPFHGPIEILVKGSRLAIGRGMAERILVKVIN